MIRLGTPDIKPDDIQAVSRVLMSGDLVQGREVAAFESELAEYIGGEHHVVAMSNCTSALDAALRAFGVGVGDLVVTSSYSWIATANVIELVGAQPRFVDIDTTSYNLDPVRLHDLVHRMKRSGEARALKAILPVHAFGYVAELGPIRDLAEDLSIPIIEDAACALGASFEDRSAGTVGDIGCFSFHPRKSLTTGEGGALVTRDSVVADFVRSFRNHGQVPGGVQNFEHIGHNYRLTNVMAALGRSQLRRLPEMLATRHRIFELYLKRLEGHIDLPAYDPIRHAGQAFVVRIPPGVDRARVIHDMRTAGIECGTGTVPIPFTRAYVRKYGYRPKDFPVLSVVAASALALPLHSGLSEEEADIVAEALLDSIKVQ